MFKDYPVNYQISFSKEPHKIPIHQIWFKPIKIESLEHLGEVICSGVWSPNIWRNGRRLGENFLGSNFMTYDFDEGTTVEAVIKYCTDRDVAFVIGATRNHQKSKNGKPPCDRFRLVIPFAETVEKNEDLKHTLRIGARALCVDPSCNEGARLFFPCTKILAIRDGLAVYHEKAPPYKPPVYKQTLKRNNMLPRWLAEMAVQFVPPGGTGGGSYAFQGRNNFIFMLARNLAEHGLSDSAVMDICMKNPTEPEEDKVNVIRRGIAAKRNE